MKQGIILFLMVVIALGIDLTPALIEDARQDRIRVTLTGAVENPGTIEVQIYSTVQEALEYAELSGNADLSSVNTEMILKDRDVINIPEKKEPDEMQRVSINQGTVEELSGLPGIGPSTAQKIIDYRNANGLFQNTEDIMNVSGIGEKKYEKIKDLIML